MDVQVGEKIWSSANLIGMGEEIEKLVDSCNVAKALFHWASDMAARQEISDMAQAVFDEAIPGQGETCGEGHH